MYEYLCTLDTKKYEFGAVDGDTDGATDGDAAVGGSVGDVDGDPDGGIVGTVGSLQLYLGVWMWV